MSVSCNTVLNRWIKEYLPTLQERRKWQNSQPNISVGDVVLVIDENTARNNCPKGIVSEIYPSEDGLVRKVLVKTQSSSFERPIHKLVLLLKAE